MQALYGKMSAPRLRVLAYHGVDDPSSFAAHVRFIRESMVPVSLDEVEAAWDGRRALPPKAALVTFDDGHRSVLEQGLPILRRFGVPAVAFVVPGVIGSCQPYWWDEVVDLLRAGGRLPAFPHENNPDTVVRRLKTVPDRQRMGALDHLRATVGGSGSRAAQLDWPELAELELGEVRVENHSLTHPCLDLCDDEKIVAEIDRSHQLLADALGREPRAFAYPNGSWDPRVRNGLADRGYRLAFLFDHRLADRPETDRLTISRLRVDSTASLHRFQTIVSGLLPALHHARGRA